MTGVRGNERGVLANTPCEFLAAGIELMLEVGPVAINHSDVDQEVLEHTDRRLAGDRGRIPREVMERDLVPTRRSSS